MQQLRSPEDLMAHITNMESENSVSHVFALGKGEFAIMLQDGKFITAEILANPKLKQIIDESREDVIQGLGIATSELLNS